MTNNVYQSEPEPCDHIIGTWASWLDVAESEGHLARESEMTGKEGTDLADVFDYCPDCGARLKDGE